MMSIDGPPMLSTRQGPIGMLCLRPVPARYETGPVIRAQRVEMSMIEAPKRLNEGNHRPGQRAGLCAGEPSARWPGASGMAALAHSAGRASLSTHARQGLGEGLRTHELLPQA